VEDNKGVCGGSSGSNVIVQEGKVNLFLSLLSPLFGYSLLAPGGWSENMSRLLTC
jgi:hypothetical protein